MVLAPRWCVRRRVDLAIMRLSVLLAVLPLAGEVHPDYQSAMIPMRDGVRLQTVVMRPKQQNGPLPFLITRTPYGVPAEDSVARGLPESQRAILDRYIVVIQNIRGRFKSEGTFVMQRPRNPRGVDETTDAWDTVDWLVKNVAGNNGRAGFIGTSYDAWTAVQAALHPHPAVKAIVEQASPADMWLGDDFHHNGAFRLSYGFEYAALLESAAEENHHFVFDRPDTSDWYLALGPLRNADARYFHGRIPTWRDFVAHPDYDEFWRRQTVVPLINDVKVPTLNVAGWWDQEDFYGPQKIYEALERHDVRRWNHFVAGPWNHGQWSGYGGRLGDIEFGSDTALHYRERIALPWLDYWLRGEGSGELAEATVFETGSNVWREYAKWPPVDGVATRKLYLQAGGALSFDRPTDRGKAFTKYVSDPANPVPYRPRPVSPTYPGPEWPVWLVQDQRFLAKRKDVVSWRTTPLADDLRVVGNIVANLWASTSGTDSDWVVKLIDVAEDGFQLIVADEILRARYRNSFEKPEAVPASTPVEYRIDLHAADHVFKKGHRVMVQVQSTWFPLYDRNPQRFAPNIFEAAESDYRKATQRVYHSDRRASSIILPTL